MSEYLKNKEYKKETLKRLITDLHNGRDFEDIKREFNQLVNGVDSVEIADLEQELMAEGLSPEEIKRLCDVHAALFREALARNEQVELPEKHPLRLMKKENDEARKVLTEIESMLDRLPDDATRQGTPLERLREKIVSFGEVLDKHYRRKENLFFPYLEKHNITGPPAVMWAVDDEIRRMLKDFSVLLENAVADREAPGRIRDSFATLRDKITEMFSKEEDILIPMLKNTLTETEWAEIRDEVEGKEAAVPYRPGANNGIALDTGTLTPAEINAVLTNLPVDITFVDRNDEVRYFSQTKERIFPRNRSIIGRKVQNCHPPASVHVVDKIINDFKHGRQNRAEFWLQLDGRFIYIQYLALRDNTGNYLGTLEVTQDITRARSLEGEQRLLKYTAEPVGAPQ